MLNQSDIPQLAQQGILQPTIGVYPLTALGVSFFHHGNASLLICKKDSATAEMLHNKPFLKIHAQGGLKEPYIEGQFTNGIVDAYEQAQLPALLLCTPKYDALSALFDELADLAKHLLDQGCLNAMEGFQGLAFPVVILASNGIIYDEALYLFAKKLEERGIPGILVSLLKEKLLRASVMQGAYRDHDLYYPLKKGLLKLAVPNYGLFKDVIDLISDKGLNVSIQKNIYRVEFEKAMVNIAANTTAMVFALDKFGYNLRKIEMKEALEPTNIPYARFVRELQEAILTVGKNVGAYTETDTLEKVWHPRKEQIIKHDSHHVSSSLRTFRKMILQRSVPKEIPPDEKALIYPLKGFSKYYSLEKEYALFEELERMLQNNLTFARLDASRITIDW